MTVEKISEATIRRHANAALFNRGEDYYQRRAVTDLTQRGNLLQAVVEGNDVQPYRVTVRFDSGGITACCTCPYDYENWCKHIVATLLTCIRQPDLIEERPPLERLLDRLDHVQTQRLVQALVAEHPELMNAVDRHISLMMSTPAKPAVVQRRHTVDVAPFRRQVKQILRDGIRQLEYGSEDDPFTDDLLTIIEKAQEFSHTGDGSNAIAILEAITQAYAEKWHELMDYGGDVYSLADHLDQAWSEAILSTDIPEPQAIDLRVQLETWQDEIDTDFSMSLAALQQGWDDPQLQQILAGEHTILWSNSRPTFADDLAMLRLQILERQGREQEYLNLAQAEGLTQQYLTRLAALGDVESAIAAARTDLNTAEAALALAQTLREQDRFAEALEIAQAGLSLPGQCRYELATWMSELAERLGQTNATFAASVVAFKTRPSLRDYHRVEASVGDNWVQIKPDLLQALRDNRNWGLEKAKVDVFLYEGLIEDAIAIVSPTDGYHATDLIQRVMEAAIPHHPEWVIEQARRRAEPIMERGKSDYYAEAVQWLQYAKLAYGQLGQQLDWLSYRNQLLTDHARKRKLIELFKRMDDS